jgi:hypothetical protein
MAAIRASQLAPKGTEEAPDTHTEKVDTKGKGKVDGDLRKSKLGVSQALGKAWRTASAAVVRLPHPLTSPHFGSGCIS